MDVKARTPEHRAVKSSSSKAHPLPLSSTSRWPRPLASTCLFRSLYFSAFLSFFDNIKRPLVVARAFIKSAPERKKASRALEGTTVRVLRLWIFRVSGEIAR